MTPVIDETMLTAYALGELSGTERAAVAAHLAGHPDARQYVAEMRTTANLLSDELARESFGGMTDLQHAEIEEKLSEMLQVPAVRYSTRRKSYWNQAVFAVSLAASIVIVLGGLSLLLPFINDHVQSALRPSSAPTTPPSNPIYTQNIPPSPTIPGLEISHPGEGTAVSVAPTDRVVDGNETGSDAEQWI